MSDTNSYDFIIIGAGAAGLYCSSLLGQKGYRVLLLEHNKVPGRKILISGGGRCNFTNTETTNENFFSSNIHFFKSALSRYYPSDFIELVEKHNIQYFEKKSGQLFCQKSAKEIVLMLESECRKGNVEIRYLTKVSEVNHNDKFEVITSEGNFNCDQLVIATGGLSISQIGASDFGTKLAKKFGHKIIPQVPALVPFTLKEDVLDFTKELAGVSLEVESRINQHVFRESMLFTHKGLSGPNVLTMSLYWNPSEEFIVNFLPDENVENLFVKESHKNILQILKGRLPERFINVWANLIDWPVERKIAEVSNKEKQKIIESLTSYRFKPNGTEGFRKAEVTRGGVDVNEVSSKTMESKKQKGLYFIGEVLDVTGELGGFNFQWAWASAYALSSNF